MLTVCCLTYCTPGSAGTVVIYDNYIYHNALPNTSGRDRCALITSYQPLRLGATGSQSGQVLGNAQRLLAQGRLAQDRPVLRQLLGGRIAGLLDGPMEPAWWLSNPSPDNR